MRTHFLLNLFLLFLLSLSLALADDPGSFVGNVSVSLDSYATSAQDVRMTVSFVGVVALPGSGGIQLKLPSGMSASVSDTSVVSTSSNLDGSWAVSTDGSWLNLTRGGDGNSGADSLLGQGGADRITSNDGEADQQISGGPGTDELLADENDCDVITAVEVLTGACSPE